MVRAEVMSGDCDEVAWQTDLHQKVTDVGQVLYNLLLGAETYRFGLSGQYTCLITVTVN